MSATEFRGVRRPGADGPELMTLGKALAALRRFKGMTQGEAGAALGISLQAWGKYEAGLCPGIISPAAQGRLERALGCEPGALAKARQAQTVSERILSPQTQDADAAIPCFIRRVRDGFELTIDLDELRSGGALKISLVGGGA